MRYFLMIIATVMAVVSAELNSLEELDIDNLLKNDDQRKAAFDCLMDKAPCGELQMLRDSIPQLVETKCSQCTPKQKEKFDQINQLLFKKYPKQYEALVLKYSPKSE